MFWKNQLYNKLKLMMNMELSYYWDLHPGNIDDPFFHCWDMCPENWDYEALPIMDMCHKIQWDLVVFVDNCLQLTIDSHHVLSHILCGVFEKLIAIIKWMWLEKFRCEKIVFAAIVSKQCHPHFVNVSRCTCSPLFTDRYSECRINMPTPKWEHPYYCRMHAF